MWIPIPPKMWWADAGREHGRYLIQEVTLPGLWDRKAFQLRHVDPATARADPFASGYLVCERYEHEQAVSAAQQHFYTRVHYKEASVSDDYPALAKTRFYMPISDGTKRAALVLTKDDDDGVRFAQVVMMSRGSSDDGSYQPVVVAQLPLAENV